MYNQLLFKAHQLGYLVPDVDKSRQAAKPDKYVGATVLDALKGSHLQPVVVLDYASLYPR